MVGGSKLIASLFGEKLSEMGFLTSFFGCFWPTLDIAYENKSYKLSDLQ
jgi:hypothetical protein